MQLIHLLHSQLFPGGIEEAVSEGGTMRQLQLLINL